MRVISAFLVALIVLLLINPMVALVFALPFLAPFWLTEPLARFLAIPLIFASVATPIAIWFGIRLIKLHWHWPATAALMFLAAFFGSTELYSKYRIIEAAHSINADCYHAQSFFQSVSTLVIYMGVSGVAHIQDELLYGLPDTTPVAVVQNASLPTQRHAVCTLAELQATITREARTA